MKKVRILIDTPEGLHLTLSLKEARELRDMLVEALGEKKEYIPYEIPRTPSLPLMGINDNKPFGKYPEYPEYPTITCSNHANYLDLCS